MFVSFLNIPTLQECEPFQELWLLFAYPKLLNGRYDEVEYGQVLIESPDIKIWRADENKRKLRVLRLRVLSVESNRVTKCGITNTIPIFNSLFLSTGPVTDYRAFWSLFLPV